jgi:hypothetical protein
VPEVGLVLSSPFVRAWQIAELLEQAGWPAPVCCEELETDYPPHKVLNVLERYGDLSSVAIVGHRPGLHELVSYLLTGDMLGEDCGARPDQKRRRGSPLLRLITRAGRGLSQMVVHAEGAAGCGPQAPASGRRRLAAQRYPREGFEFGVRGGAQAQKGEFYTIDGERADRPVAVALDGGDELVGGWRAVLGLEVG